MKFEYKIVRLTDETGGLARAEIKLNFLGQEGWDLLPLQLPGCWGVMKRIISE